MIRLGHAPRTPIRVMGHDPIPQLVSVGHDLSFQLGALGHDPHPCAPPGAVPTLRNMHLAVRRSEFIRIHWILYRDPEETRIPHPPRMLPVLGHGSNRTSDPVHAGSVVLPL